MSPGWVRTQGLGLGLWPTGLGLGLWSNGLILRLMDSDSGLMDSDSDSDSGLVDSNSLLDSRVRTHSNTAYYVLKYDNFKSVEVQGWTPLEILIFLHWTCRPTFTTLLGEHRAILHLMAVPKNRGKCKSATISLHRGDSLSASGPPWLDMGEFLQDSHL